jgi:hypothetical protein
MGKLGGQTAVIPGGQVRAHATQLEARGADIVAVDGALYVAGAPKFSSAPLR